jgi:hypothetical protein
MCANKKIQDISMKAATGNHQILGLPIVSQRPIADIHSSLSVNRVSFRICILSSSEKPILKIIIVNSDSKE